ncbi:MAG TPA: hypothetical protein VJS89_07130 [Gammaproteobacteria bacterium]|nr:hypothetical protein [Gammaproteobacteria bacterium]
MVSNRLSRWTLLFFACALVNFLAAQGVILSGASWPIQPVAAPGTLVAVHLLTIGWLLLLMLGALFQFIPVITSNVLPSQHLELVTLCAIEIGLLFMICGFIAMGMGAAPLVRCLPAGGALVMAGVLLAGYDLGVPLLKARPLSLPGRMVLTGLAFLLATIALGLLFALTISVPALSGRLGVLLANGVGYHALAGLGGWFTLTAMGVTYKLVPMFTLAPEERGLAGELVHSLAAAGFALALIFGLLHIWIPARALQDLEYAGCLLVVAAIGIYLWDMVRIYRTRRRTVLELHNKAAVGAFVLLGVCVVMALVLAGLGRFAGDAAIFVFLVVFGWLSGLGLTQLYKIVPFLAWLGRFGQKLGHGPVPRVQDLVDESRSYPWFIIYFIGVLLAALAAFSGEFYVFRAGIGLGVIATLGLMLEYWRAWRGYYAKRKPQIAPTLPPFMTAKPAIASPQVAKHTVPISPIADKYGASHDEHP